MSVKIRNEEGKFIALPNIKGDKGDQGERGLQGERGPKGDTGAPGANGQDGYTPVKGVDYFTTQDIESLNIPKKLEQLENTTQINSSDFLLINQNTLDKKIKIENIDNRYLKLNDTTKGYIDGQINELEDKYKENILYNADLNDLQEKGFYYTDSASNRPNIAEKSRKGFLIVQKINNMIMQIFYSDNCHRAYFRNKQENAEWSEWWNILIGHGVTGRLEVRYPETESPWLFIEGADEDVTAYGVNVWRSDKRFKKNIKDSKYKALDKLMQIKHREFTWKSNNKKIELGVVADELENIDKNLIFEVGDKKIKQINENKYIVLLSKAVQEQQEIINNLNKRIEELEEVVCKKKKN